MAINWDFTVIWHNRDALLLGLWMTVKLTVVSGGLGTILAFPIALACRSTRVEIRWPVIAVVELLRAIPLPLKLLWMYFGLPAMGGPEFSPIVTALVTFTANFAVFAADVFRGAIRDVPRSQVDSAVALGMSRLQVVRRVLLPETIRRALPAWNGLFVTLFKLSSLASMIAVPELLHTASLVLTDRPKPFEVYTALVVLYAAMVLPVSIALRRLESTRWFTLEVARP